MVPKEMDSTYQKRLAAYVHAYCDVFYARLPWQGMVKLYKGSIFVITINVTRVQSSKFLGIIIDENLNWKPHIQLVKSKLSKTLSIIYKASKLINYEWMLTLYFSLFLPYLTYCCEIWGTTFATNVNCIY